MPEQASGERRGLFESLSRFGATLVAAVHTRLELLSVDLEEEREHLLSIMLLAFTSLFLLGVGIVLAVILVVTTFWDTQHRLLVLASLTVLFLIMGLAAGMFALYKTRTKPRLFTASLSELSKDQQQLTSRS